MVLWRLFAVILLLCGTTCSKKDNDLRMMSSSLMDPGQAGFPDFDGNALPSRYSKLLSVLKENLHVDAEANPGFDNVKTKKNRGAVKTDFLANDSLDEDIQDDVTQSEDDERIGSLLSTYDYYEFFKNDVTKRGTNSCDCKVKNDLLDLGHLHYPRYLLNAVCQKEDDTFDYPPKCWRGTQCKPLEYKVRVLTYRSHNDHLQKDPTMSLLPDVLRSFWKFKTVTVAAGCFCS